MARCTALLAWILAIGALLAVDAPARAESLDPRLEAAAQLYREEGAEKALPVFEALAGEFDRAKQPRDRAAALHYVGECHWRLGNFDAARRSLERALGAERASGDRLGEGRTLNVRGLLAWDEGDYDRAIRDFRKAGELASAAGDKKLEGASLNNLSLVFDERGEYDTSLRQYRRVLELFRSAEFPRGVGDTLGNIGGVHLLLGQFREALGHYQQALRISEQLKSKASMSQDHGNIGLCLLGLGEVDAALAHFDQATGLAMQAGMLQDQAYWLRAKGNGLVQQGQYGRALRSYRAALAIYEHLGAQAELVEALHDAGRLHLLLGDSVSAERDFERALETAQSLGFDRGVTRNLISLGDVELRRGQPENALARYEQARGRAAAAGQQHALALSLLRLARANRIEQMLSPATTQTDQALAIARRIGTPGLEAEALFSGAEIARLQRRLGAALDGYGAAQHALARIGDPDLLWQILFGRARAQESGGDVSGAIGSLEEAVRLIESVRAQLQEPRFRAGYVDDKYEVYLTLLRLQLQQGRTEDAFTTAERLRARSFVEQLGGRMSVPLSVGERRREAELRERVRKLQQTLDQTGEERAAAYPDRALTRFSRELQQAEKEYAAFIDDHARNRVASGAAPGVAEVQRRLAPGEALLEYVVGPESAVVFVVTAHGMTVMSLPAGEAVLRARVELLRDLIRQPGDDRWRKPAARLSTELYEPLERARLLEGTTHLYVVPHGVLTYLPFGLLPRFAAGRDELLVDRYTVTYLPSAAALLGGPSARATTGTLLAVAPARSGLRYASQEARAVNALFQPHARMLIGSEATERRFKELSGDYRVLHLATHGYFNKASPLLSGLKLEPDEHDDGMLRVHEILDLPLRADLVTLSACDTALGSGYFAELPAGDEFVALNRAFLAAGSATVMATLWQVDDQASVSLMRQFYARLRSGGSGRDAAGALTSAQRALRRSPRLAHPYYWAAYVVVGHTDSRDKVAESSSGRMS